MAEGVEVFEAERARLVGLAYRLLGEVHTAEDVVQDAYLRWDGADRERIEAPGAWLAKVVTNLCLTRLASAAARRETYPGEWLPEPAATDGGGFGPLDTVEQRDTISLALLHLMERLSPPERAAFVLREAFGYSHREIAALLDTTEAASRQLHHRARARLGDRRPRYEAEPGRWHALVERFLAAATGGDVAGLESVLTADVVVHGDGGGKVSAARRPIEGRDKVVRFLVGLGTTQVGDLEFEVAEYNAAPALVGRRDGAIQAIAVPEVVDDRIQALRIVLNPDKLPDEG